LRRHSIFFCLRSFPLKVHLKLSGMADVATSPPHSDAGTVGYDDRSSAEGDEGLASTVCSGVSRGEMTLLLHPDSAGGTYFVIDEREKPIAVFKPGDEEIGQEKNPHGNTDSERVEFTPGMGYLREALAYYLDYEHNAGVPETHIVTLNNMVGSLHRFIPNCSEAGNHLPGKFPVEVVHRLAILDIRLLNGDRHGGNILVQENGQNLVPIDHSYVLPPCFVDPDFEWMSWPQSKVPFGPACLRYIAALDARRDRELVASMLGDEAGDMVAVTTLVLQYGARRGLSCREIASFCRRETLTQPARLEELVAESCGSIDDGGRIDIARAEELLPSFFGA
jgi:hypothetical protein